MENTEETEMKKFVLKDKTITTVNEREDQLRKLRLEKELEDEENELNRPIHSDEKTITDELLSKILKSSRDFSEVYEANRKLYIIQQDIFYISNLDRFINLNVLYLNGNKIQRISGLSTLTHLTSLYLHMNLISRIQGLDKLVELRNLNLAENLITCIEGLEHNKKLDFLILSHNRIGKNGIQDFVKLAEIHSLTSLDISNNLIQSDGKNDEMFEEVFHKLSNLGALYLLRNPVCHDMVSYRKRMIFGLKNLNYLDDMPIKVEERRFAVAYIKGGAEAVEAEKKSFIEEQKNLKKDRMSSFNDLISNKEKQTQKLKEEEDKIRREAEEREKALLIQYEEKERLRNLVQEQDEQKSEHEDEPHETKKQQ